MSSTKEIKQRIGNVRSVEQIINAMNMVASTKLSKARAQLDGVRPIYRESKRVVEELGNASDAKTHIFYKERDIKHSLYIIITSDSGLSGSYNANIIATTLDHMNRGKNEKIVAVGSKGYEYFKKKDKHIIHKIIDMPDTEVYYGTESLSKWLTNFYLSGEVQEVFIAYTHFENVLNYTPKIERLLPIACKPTESEQSDHKKYEPNTKEFIDHAVPFYLHMNLFRAFSESHTSEQAARMVNMDAAGKNASEIIDDLSHQYNRKRQAAITQELNEIVGSTNIMNKGGLNDG